MLGENWRDAGAGGRAQAEQQQGGERQQPGAAIATAIPPLPQVDEPPHWRPVGRIEGLYTVDPQPAFAVVQLGPFQYKVTADDVILHPKLVGAEVNDVLALEKVLLLGSTEVRADAWVMQMCLLLPSRHGRGNDCN